MKRKKSGFTLIELLGAITILAVLALLVVPAVYNTLGNHKEKLYESQIKSIRSSLQTWGDANSLILPTENNKPVKITLGELKSYGFIDYEIRNPKTEKCLSNSMQLTIVQEGSGYKYDVDDSGTIDGPEEDCTTADNSPVIKLTGEETIYLEEGATFTDPGYTVVPTEATHSSALYNNAGNKVTGALSIGVYTAKYTATLGNKTVYSYRKVVVEAKVDETIPAVTLTSLSKTSNSVTLSATVTTMGKTGIKKYEFSKDGVMWNTINSTETPATKTYTGLSINTDYTFYVRVTSAAGKLSGVKALTIRTNDIAKPTLIASPNPSTWTNQNVAINITYPNPKQSDWTYQYSINGGSSWTTVPTDTTTSFILSTTGSWTVVARVQDNGNGENVNSNALTIPIDKTPPTFAVSGNPTEWAKDAVLTISATDNGYSGLHAQAYSFDNGATWVATANKSFAANQTVNIKVRDVAMNVSDAQSIVINRIDETTPVVTLTSTAKTSSQVSVSATVTTVGGTGVKNYQFSKDGSNWETTTSTSTSATKVFSGLTKNTSYTFYVKVTGANDKVSTTKTVAVTTDNIGSVTMSADKTGTVGTDVKVTITYPTPKLSTWQYQYSLNGGSTWTSVTSSPYVYTFTVIGGSGLTGTIIGRVNDTGNIGNNVQSATTTVAIDKIKPTISSLSFSGVTTTSMRVTANSATDPGTPSTGIKTYHFSRNGTTWYSTTNNYYDFTGLTADTEYTLRAYVTDNVDNKGDEITKTQRTVGCQYAINQTFDYNYNGSEQTFTTANLCGGQYKYEVWGAQGGGTNGGLGGYAYGNTTLAANQTVRVYVGGKPTGITGGYLGGGNGSSGAYGGGGLSYISSYPYVAPNLIVNGIGSKFQASAQGSYPYTIGPASSTSVAITILFDYSNHGTRCVEIYLTKNGSDYSLIDYAPINGPDVPTGGTTMTAYGTGNVGDVWGIRAYAKSGHSPMLVNITLKGLVGLDSQSGETFDDSSSPPLIVAAGGGGQGLSSATGSNSGFGYNTSKKLHGTNATSGGGGGSGYYGGNGSTSGAGGGGGYNYTSGVSTPRGSLDGQRSGHGFIRITYLGK